MTRHATTLPTPCAHLVTVATPYCALDRRFPHDCPGCSAYSPGLTEAERIRCEVWTSVTGYHRPVSAFNAGKRAEHAERAYFCEGQG